MNHVTCSARICCCCCCCLCSRRNCCFCCSISWARWSMSICFMMAAWGWLPRKPGPAGPAPDTMPPEPGGTEDCMGPVVRGSPTGCCSWEDRKTRECTDFISERKHGAESRGSPWTWGVLSGTHSIPQNNLVILKSGLTTVELERYRGTVIEDGAGTSERRSSLFWMGLIKGQRPGNQLTFCISPKERDEDLRLDLKPLNLYCPPGLNGLLLSQ